MTIFSFLANHQSRHQDTSSKDYQPVDCMYFNVPHGFVLVYMWVNNILTSSPLRVYLKRNWTIQEVPIYACYFVVSPWHPHKQSHSFTALWVPIKITKNSARHRLYIKSRFQIYYLHVYYSNRIIRSKISGIWGNSVRFERFTGSRLIHLSLSCKIWFPIYDY